MSKPATNLRINIGGAWNRRVAVLGLGLLVILPLSFTALDYLVPKSLSHGRGALTRAGWYLSSGQWHADVRTLASAFEYIVNSDPSDPVQADPPANQLAVPLRPVGPNPTSMIEVQGGGFRLPNT